MGVYARKVDIINKALLDQGIDGLDLERESAQELPAILFDDELPLLAGLGDHQFFKGLLVATDRRILFVGDSVMEDEPAYEAFGVSHIRPPVPKGSRTIEVGFNQPDWVGRDTIESVASITQSDQSDLHVTYHSWELREMGTATERVALIVNLSSEEKAQQFADFLRPHINPQDSRGLDPS